MKKLLIAAASMSVAASAFASTSTIDVYDYKASVKYVDMVKKNVRVTTLVPNYLYGNNEVTQVVTVFLKTVKTASLTGYVVYESCCGASVKRDGFLVVANKGSSADRGVPKILPVDLMAKYWFTTQDAKTVETEGYLFAGYGKYDNPYTYGRNPGLDQFELYSGSNLPMYKFGLSDSYGTRFLFGQYNDIDPATGFFFDAWLDASGFGKGVISSTTIGGGCSLPLTMKGACLDSLSGSVIGGMWLCHQNAYPLQPWEGWFCGQWTGTSDVITGTWSIKRTAKVLPVDLTIEEEVDLIPASGRSQDLLEMVKGAAQKIKAGTDLEDLYLPLIDLPEYWNPAP